MITLQIDEQTYSSWREQAFARGLSVEEWLRAATTGERVPDEELEFGESATPAAGLSSGTLRERLEAIARRHPPTGRPVDDSRESIYD